MLDLAQLGQALLEALPFGSLDQVGDRGHAAAGPAGLRGCAAQRSEPGAGCLRQRAPALVVPVQREGSAAAADSVASWPVNDQQQRVVHAGSLVANGAPLTPLAQLAAEAKRRHDAGVSMEAIGEWLAESLPPGTMGDLASIAQITTESLRAAGILPTSEGTQERDSAALPKRGGG